jgi:hypothetical protein
MSLLSIAPFGVRLLGALLSVEIAARPPADGP